MMQKIDTLTIVPVCKEDVPILAAIAAASFPDPWSESLFAQTLEHPDSHCLKAILPDGTITGYLILQRLGDEISVDDIATAPEFRRCGIARQLLQNAVQQFPDCNFLLEVREHNVPALALYQHFGFVQVGFRKRYYHNPEEGAVLMTRTAIS